jgi:4-amino-4-deoxy-L-arabinose transferase-like glycosyltransferase
MLETGDFLHIRLQEEPRYKKPIGVYWMQAASVAMVSDVEKREIWAWRLPSMLGALLATLACFWGGIACVGRRAAFVGAGLLAVSVLLSTEAMIAKTDAMLCGATTLAMAALGRVFLRRGGAKAAILFWAALALGVLVKGPITPMVAVLCVVALSGWKRDVRWLAPLASPLGVLVAALILAPWAYALMQAEEGAKALAAMTRDIAPKLGGGGEHGSRPPGLHLLLLPVLIFPASIGLAPAAMSVWRTLRAPRDDARLDGLRFLIAWAAPTWLVFEIATTKLAHYTLPAYPAIALMAGAGLLRWLATPTTFRRLGLAIGTVVGSLGIAAAAGVLTFYAPSGRAFLTVVDGALVAGLCVLVAILATTLALIAQTPGKTLAPILVAALSLLIATREGVAPRADKLLVSRATHRALAQADTDRNPNLPLLIVGYREPSLVFVEGTNTILRQGSEGAVEAQLDQVVVVSSAEEGKFLQGLHRRGMTLEHIGHPIGGINYSNGDFVRLQPGRIRKISDARN